MEVLQWSFTLLTPSVWLVFCIWGKGASYTVLVADGTFLLRNVAEDREHTPPHITDSSAHL